MIHPDFDLMCWIASYICWGAKMARHSEDIEWFDVLFYVAMGSILICRVLFRAFGPF